MICKWFEKKSEHAETAVALYHCRERQYQSCQVQSDSIFQCLTKNLDLDISIPHRGWAIIMCIWWQVSCWEMSRFLTYLWYFRKLMIFRKKKRYFRKLIIFRKKKSILGILFYLGRILDALFQHAISSLYLAIFPNSHHVHRNAFLI